MPLKIGDFIKIDRADDVDNRELTGFTGNDRKARDLVIIKSDADAYVLVLFLIMHLR